MKLEEWRKTNQYTYARLAEILGVGGATVVRRWCLPRSHPNSMTPRPKHIRDIMTITMGSVSANDFYRHDDL